MLKFKYVQVEGGALEGLHHSDIFLHVFPTITRPITGLAFSGAMYFENTYAGEPLLP